MDAEIIGFPSHRFTTADLEHLQQLSDDMIARGVWDTCERYTDNGVAGLRYDQWLIFTDALSEATFSVERRSTGMYFLTDARSGSSLFCGSTVQEVTRRWTAAFDNPAGLH
jgi:hypothetical protein